jgi:hypothetical protein
MDTETKRRYRTKLIPFRDSEGNIVEYLEVPDKSDPAFQAEMQEHWDRLDAALERAAKKLGITRDELVEEILRD